ncbi:MAG: succinate dehydrogenase, hydrophobic membrane anchor protein, partial [Gammaproteobacteria bacterium]
HRNSADSINHLTWTAQVSETCKQVLTFATVLAISIHAWVGLWIVSTDYIKPTGIRNAFQALVLVVCLGTIVWAGKIFWG